LRRLLGGPGAIACALQFTDALPARMPPPSLGLKKRKTEIRGCAMAQPELIETLPSKPVPVDEIEKFLNENLLSDTYVDLMFKKSAWPDGESHRPVPESYLIDRPSNEKLAEIIRKTINDYYDCNAGTSYAVTIAIEPIKV
jgi:hypothetical protein